MQYLHSMLRVNNLETALDFFCNKLNMIEVRRYNHETARFTLVFLAAKDDMAIAESEHRPCVELTYNWDTEDYSHGRNFGHLAYAVDNIYNTCQDLMDKGVIINRPPRDGYMAFIKSPDGISIELLQKGERLTPSQPWLDMKNQGEW
ncbi:MAG: lactoylglutathione lyase [Pseudohongiellaceae bacterium]|jgi:lactoylglutathione lyase